MASNSPQKGLYAGLIKGATFFVSKMEQKIDSEGLSKRIKDATSIGSPVVKGDGGYIDVTIDLSKDAAPMAAAFEYGSGIHGKEGKTYKIEPDEKDFLAFEWDKVDSSSSRGGKFRGVSKRTGKAIFSFVDHPGVRERPYIRPTINDHKKEIAKLIGREFIESITVRGKTVIE